MGDLINRKATIDSICRTVCDNPEICESPCDEIKVLEIMPSAQPEKRTEERTETHACDLIDRQAAIDTLDKHLRTTDVPVSYPGIISALTEWLNELPSAQPERTCVNCGRTVNNGGWYADGGTRCPIEEHYALPKDGFCHLWEKRNVTDDDYPERRTDGRD